MEYQKLAPNTGKTQGPYLWGSAPELQALGNLSLCEKLASEQERAGTSHASGFQQTDSPASQLREQCSADEPVTAALQKPLATRISRRLLGFHLCGPV